MFNIWRILCYCFGGIAFLSSCAEPSKQKITIATSANMQFVMHELVEDFNLRTNIECDLIIGSSGKLTAQISEGAPYDILVAANMKYPEFIHAQGLSTNPPKIYAYGKLVLWTADSSLDPSLELLLSNSTDKIALANPQTAPYGEAAIDVLKKHGLLDSLQHKLVYGESVAQTNQFIISGAADVGFTALSVVKSELMRNKGKWMLIDKEDYKPIAQGVVLLNTKKKVNRLAKEFYDYLFSEEAGEILEEFGYSRNE